ncbi:unnamed protein product [Prorocentrum cordatum]|uniref:Pentatricopeptide repeat-containing protein, chloroplastic n=1 Tax=Prorocentrum cordatum TaxID=2364126 RepID=A0ABN9RNF1_9DINO|nr:unnamed protein product [Polarella glacialis]
MPQAKLEPDVVSYNAGISACEKGGQWQRALALLSEIGEARIKPTVITRLQRWDQRVREGGAVAAGPGAARQDVGCEAGAHRHQLQRWDQRLRERRAVAAGPGAARRRAGGGAGARRLSCNAGISACEKGGQWQRALALLGETSEARLEPSVILQRLHQRVREWRAVAACSVAAQRDVRGNSKAHRHQLQRRDQRVREGRAVAAGPGATQRHVGGEAESQSLVSYSACISACEKGEQWQHALSLLSEMREATWNDDVIGYSAGISACEKGQQWQRALALLLEMREAKLEPNATSATALGSARARRAGSGCGHWRCSARCGRRGWSLTFHLQRCDQRVREGRAMAVGHVSAQRDA